MTTIFFTAWFSIGFTTWLITLCIEETEYDFHLVKWWLDVIVIFLFTIIVAWPAIIALYIMQAKSTNDARKISRKRLNQSQ